MSGASDPSRVRMSGPVVGYSQGLVVELASLGYATTTAAAELVRLAAHLSRWLQGSGLGLAELSPSVIDASVAERRASHVNLASARALDPMVGYLRRVGAVPEPLPAVPTTAAQVVLDGFVRFLLDERTVSAPARLGTSSNTVVARLDSACHRPTRVLPAPHAISSCAWS